MAKRRSKPTKEAEGPASRRPASAGSKRPVDWPNWIPVIHRIGYKVSAPIGKKADGEWSGRHRIIAVFLSRGEAVEYAAAKRAKGVPVSIRRSPGAAMSKKARR